MRRVIKRSLPIVAVASLAVGLLAAPSTAFDASVERQLRSANGDPMGCSIKVHRVSRDYHATVRNLTVEGVAVCDKGVHPENDVIGLQFQPHVTKDRRHITYYAVKDYSDRFRMDFTAAAQCNRKWDGVWNHQRREVEHVIVKGRADGDHYRVQMRVDVPGWTC
jgi:hypothetical protein